MLGLAKGHEMLKEHGRVRAKATGMYGTIVDWRSGSDHCAVELDGWQRNALPEEDDLLLRTFSLSDLDELVEVRNAERKAVSKALTRWSFRPISSVLF